MKTSVFFVAWCLMWRFHPSEGNPVQLLLERFGTSLTDLNDSFQTFTSLLSHAPVEGLNYSAMVIGNIRNTTFEMVYDIYETVKPLYNGTNVDFDHLEVEMRETDKMLSYTEGLKKSMEAARDFLLSSHVREPCPMLPVGPTRVYKLSKKTDSVSRAPNKGNFEELVENIELAVEAASVSVEMIAYIIIELPTVNRVWGSLESIVKDLIHNLLVSLNMALQEVKTVVIKGEELDVHFNDRFIITASRKIRMQAEAIKDSVDSIHRYIFK